MKQRNWNQLTEVERSEILKEFEGWDLKKLQSGKWTKHTEKNKFRERTFWAVDFGRTVKL